MLWIKIGMTDNYIHLIFKVKQGKTGMRPGKVMLLMTNMFIAQKVQNAVPCWNQMTVLASEVTNLVPGNIWQHDFTVNVDGCCCATINQNKKISHHVSITWTVCCFVNWKCFWMSLNLKTYEVALKKGPLVSTIITDYSSFQQYVVDRILAGDLHCLHRMSLCFQKYTLSKLYLPTR